MAKSCPMRAGVYVVCSLALALAACGGQKPPPPNPDLNWHPASDMLLKYDANHDGIVTRAELEAGLKRDFAAADINHDGHLDADEARAVNEERLNDDQSTASPLVDWNQDGFIDFNEFATTPRSLFDQLDANSDGKLAPGELAPQTPHLQPPDRSGRQPPPDSGGYP